MIAVKKWTYIHDRMKSHFNSNLCSYAISRSDMSWEFQWDLGEFDTHFFYFFFFLMGLASLNLKLLENQP